MANKPVTTDVGANAQYNSSTLNNNFSIIENAIENCLGRGGIGESPNSMQGDLDMNFNQIKNVSEGVNPKDAVNKAQLDAIPGAAQASADAAAVSASNAAVSASSAASSASNASAYASNASISASNAAASEQQAFQYTQVSFSLGTDAYDLGLVTDPAIYFPTDLGSVA